MSNRRLLVTALLAACSVAVAQPPTKETHKDPAKPAAGQPEGMPQLPPGWTAEDMAACTAAATLGSQHERLQKTCGTWAGKCKMWMGSEMKEPMTSECVTVISPIMDGRYIKTETKGEMPGMGPFVGFGITGYDNVSQKFQCTWTDNCGTGMMTGTGVLSPDSKTLTYTCTYNCPIAKKPVTMRQIEKQTGENTMTLEMIGNDPKTGKEFKAMEIAYTRTGAAPKTTTTTTPKTDTAR